MFTFLRELVFHTSVLASYLLLSSTRSSYKPQTGVKAFLNWNQPLQNYVLGSIGTAGRV